MSLIVIRVNGVPAPQGSKRHVGNGRMIESSKKVGPWREAVRAETQRQRQGQTVEDAAIVDISIFLPRPRSHYGTGRNAGRLTPGAPLVPAGRPDLDKLIRSTLDGIVEGGALADDALIVGISAQKAYAEEGDGPGCLIVVHRYRETRMAEVQE
jgi:crossover junction endodeoxyribonuclease RusA